MLDIDFIRANKDIVAAAIKNKKVKQEVDLDELLNLYEKRKALQQEIDILNQQKNAAAKERQIEEGTRIKKELASVQEQYDSTHENFIKLMLALPNIPSADTPIGPDESANKVIRSVGEPTKFSFQPKDHAELGKALGLIDGEKATEVSGSRFVYLKGDIVLMQFALIQFGLSIITNEEKLKEIAKKANLDISVTPFIPVLPPDMLKPAVLNRMGRLEPREDKYYLPEDDLYLAGSAEHTIGPLHMDEVIPAEKLPIRYVGYSTAFRREAGTYGKDMKGIVRLHQFDKMEMETFCLPEDSYKEQEFLVAIQEHFMQELGLPYQVVLISTGDMGLPDHRQIDIEAWMPAQNTYRETHTSDLIAGFQPRRLNTRVKRADGTREPLHMNDATLFSMRPLGVILENYQQEDGSVLIPKVLQQYMGKDRIVKK